MSPHYDDVLREVSQRIDERGSIGKLDIAALTTWKRLRADTRWVAALLRLPEADVRGITTTTCTAANNRDVSASAAAGDARGSLSPLPGFARGDALASAVCAAAAPARLAVYDDRAHTALTRLGIPLDNRPGRYRRYIDIIDSLRTQLLEAGHTWPARRVDTALYQLGGR
ncbi:hypothetical protein PaSha_01455 [Pseudonocardia alni]|nr:hypothetical protein PaSha_01455 [Pseudonocardia alni]